MEQLAYQIAKAEGVSVTEVVRESLQSLAGIRGLTTKKLPLRERLAKLAYEVDSLPKRAVINHLSDNCVLT